MFVRPSSAKPRGTATDAPSIRDRVKGAGRAARAGAFVILALIALTLATPGTASADFACSFTGDDAYELDAPGANGENVFPAVNQWENEAKRAKNLNDTTGMITGAINMPGGAEKYTMYEINGVRGMNWSGTQRGRGDASQTDASIDASGADNCEIMDYVNNGIANIIFDGTKILTRISISIKELASNPSPLSGLYTERDSTVNKLKDNVFVPAVPVMIALTGFWVFGKWRKGDMREAWSGVGWASLTTIAVVVLLTGNNFHKVIDEADSGIAQANSRLAATVLSGMSGEPQPPCDLPGDAPNFGLRVSSCAMYDTLAFRPWALGQFGEGGANCIFKNKGGGKVANGVCHPGDNVTKSCNWGKPGSARCEDLRVRQMVTQSLTNIDVTGDEKTDEEKKYKTDWYAVRQDLAGGKGNNNKHGDAYIYPVSFNEWAGRDAGNRIGLAFYSLIAALIVGIMVIVLSALTLLWHSVTLIMIIMLPLIATLGIHPSQQKLLKGWLQTFIHSFVLRAGFGVILTVLLVLYQMILPARISLGMQLLMLILVSVSVVMMLKKLLSGAYSPQIAGAQDALGVGDMANTVGGKLAQYTPGVVAGVTKTTGRVAGKTAVGAGKTAGKTAAGAGKLAGKATMAGVRAWDTKKNDSQLQKTGKISPRNSKRDQRRRAYEAGEVQKDQYAKVLADRDPAAASGEKPSPEPEQRHSGRVSGGGTPPASVPPPRPAPTPAPAVPPQQGPWPSGGRVNAPDPGPARQQPRPPAPDPRSTPPTSPTPPPPRNDGRLNR